MSKYDTAFELTRIAIENKIVKFNSYSNNANESTEDYNNSIANQISIFYNTILNSLEPNPK